MRSFLMGRVGDFSKSFRRKTAADGDRGGRPPDRNGDGRGGARCRPHRAGRSELCHKVLPRILGDVELADEIRDGLGGTVRLPLPAAMLVEHPAVPVPDVGERVAERMPADSDRGA